MIDKELCMSRFLSFRYIEEEDLNFFPGLSHKVWKRRPDAKLHSIASAEDVGRAVREELESFFVPGRTAICLSGGIDSAILASYLPRGTKAYTFRCVADGAIDETAQAARYARICGLDHETIDMEWRDFEDLTPELLRHDGVPFHSIEVQLLKAARHAKAAGFDRLVLGESADGVFGGLDGLLSRDWTLDGLIGRYSFVRPESALKNPVSCRPVFERYKRPDGSMDIEAFIRGVFCIESSTSYMHAFELAGVEASMPYGKMRLAAPLDLARIRGGESKYFLRELFSMRYPGMEIPKKIPMPRATEQWFADWSGPHRGEFIPDCHKNMTGDQKWLVWCLERFLDEYEKGNLT